jgi:competence protein ComEC
VSVSRPRTSHLRLLPVAAGAWAVSLVTTLVPPAAVPVAGALWLLALGTLCAIARVGRMRAGRRRLAVIVLLTLAAAAAAASHVALAQPARAEAARFAVGGGRSVVIEATVVGKIELRGSGEWAFDAVAHRLSTGAVTDTVRFDIAVRVQPSEVDRADALDVGAEIELRGTARAAPPGDRAVLAVTASRGLSVRAGPAGILAVAADLRRGLIGSSQGLPAPGAGLVPGLAVGDTSAVSPELDAAMKESSLSHLTAVSGANCAIVVGLAFGAVAAAGGSRRARIAGGVVALAGFVVLVTPEPSVVRAAAMALIAMLGVLLGRTGAGSAILSLAVTVLLVADPWLCGSLGFALSALATGSLLLCARPLATGMARRMPRALALALAVPLAAQLACGPLLVVITPTVPLYGVAANLLAAPAAPVATIVGLAACLAAPLPWVQSGLTAIAWVPAAWIAGTAQTVSALPGDQVPWLDGWAGVTALAAVSLAIGTVIVSRPRRLRLAAALLLAVVAGVVAGGAALGSVAGRLTLPTGWSVLACDIGQGDAVLVRSAGAVALIDTGPDPALLAGCLARAGVDRIDLLVLTHFDLDHAGGVDAVIGRVETTLHGPVGTPAGALVLSRLDDGGAHAVAAHTGTSGTLGDAAWSVLWPPAETRAYPPGNDLSVVLDIRGGGVPTSLFLGDLSASPQAAIAASDRLDPPYDLVKVAHHGSADQHAALYGLLSPAVAILTVGADNTYGHPRAETLALLEDLGAHVARTDREGIIAMWTLARAVSVWREREGDVVPAR